MPFVLDASIAACWAFEDVNHPAAALALERIRTDEALVPCIWCRHRAAGGAVSTDLILDRDGLMPAR